MHVRRAWCEKVWAPADPLAVVEGLLGGVDTEPVVWNASTASCQFLRC